MTADEISLVALSGRRLPQILHVRGESLFFQPRRVKMKAERAAEGSVSRLRGGQRHTT